MKYLTVFTAALLVVSSASHGQSIPKVPAKKSVTPPFSIIPPLKLPGQTLGQKRKKKAPYQNGIPRPPKGLERCEEVLVATESYEMPVGETIRYVVDINGLSVGTIDFKVVNRGLYSGTEVHEYRSLFKIDSLVSTFMPVHGQAASVVELESQASLKAMNRYTIEENQFEENIEFENNASKLVSNRERNGKTVKQDRYFNYSVQDFVTAFYQLRHMPRDMNGCIVIYGNQRAYTVWLQKEGEERIQTPVGFRLADRYSIQYGSEYSKLPKKGHLWIGVDEYRLPYRVKVHARHTLEARVHFYEEGEQN